MPTPYKAINKLNDILNFLKKNNILGAFSEFLLINEQVISNQIITRSKTYIHLDLKEAISNINFEIFSFKSILKDIDKESFSLTITLGTSGEGPLITNSMTILPTMTKISFEMDEIGFMVLIETKDKQTKCKTVLKIIYPKIKIQSFWIQLRSLLAEVSVNIESFRQLSKKPFDEFFEMCKKIALRYAATRITETDIYFRSQESAQKFIEDLEREIEKEG